MATRLRWINPIVIIISVASCIAPAKLLNGIDVKPVREIAIDEDTPLQCAEIQADGKTLIIGGGSFLGPGQLSFWSLPSGKEILNQKLHKLAIWSIAISPDGKSIATGGGFGEVKLWDATTGKVLADLDSGSGYTYSVAFSPDGKLMVNGGDESVKVWDTKTHKCLVDLPNIGKSGHHEVTFSPDGKTLAVSENGAILRLWDVETWKERQPIKELFPRLKSGIYGQIGKPVYSPDGKLLLIEGGYFDPVDYSIKLWDVEAGKLVGELTGFKESMLSMVITPDGKHLIAGGRDHTIMVWEMASRKVVASWVAHKSTIRNLAISKDGKILVSCGDEGVVRVWDLPVVLEKKGLRGDK